MRRLWIALVLLLVLAACTGNSPAANTVVNDPNAACPAEIQQAFTEVGDICAATARNQVCYGNLRINLTPLSDITTPFESPGDIVDISTIANLELGIDTASGAWGVAFMRLQATLPDSLPGQNVTFMLFGDTRISPDNTVEGITAFHFSSGIGDAPCQQAPESGILIQTPEGAGEISIRLNEVDIVLGSTAFLQAQPSAEMRVNVVEGRAEVTAQNVTQVVHAGSQTRLTLDAEGNAASPPAPPEVYEPDALVRLPVANLERDIAILDSMLVTDFSTGADEWRIAGDGTPIEYISGDEAADSDGYICSNDRSTGVYWYFQSPESWAGDRSAAYGGTLDFTIREAPNNGSDRQDDILLISDKMTLTYRFEQLPRTDWTHYSIPLREDDVWQNSATSVAATAEEFQYALTNLQEIQIRGEYISGADTGCLDDVRLNIVVGQ